MKDIVLPDNAFPHEKRHNVLGYVFVKGRVRVSDEDCAKMRKPFVDFYGCTVENVEEEESAGAQDSSGDSSLTTDVTKASKDA